MSPQFSDAGRWAVALIATATLSAGCDVHTAEGDFSFGLQQGKASDTWSRQYSVSPGGRLEIVNVNGEIRAESTDGSVVEVRAERSVSASSDESAKDILSSIEMREEVGPERVRIETVTPRRRMGRQKVTYSVRVPAGVHVDLRTVNGGVHLESVGGEVRAKSTNGGIRGRLAATSLVDARTTNGGVELELVGALSEAGRVTLTSVNGGVRLTVPEGTKADVTAQCTNGRATVSDLAFEAEGEQTRRRVGGRINGGGGRIELQTVNGGASIGRS